MRRAAQAILAALGTLGLLVAAAPTASAHPLGNFSVNTYSAVVVEPARVHIDIVVDRAEIPTRQTFPDLDQPTGTVPVGRSAAYRTSQCDDVASTVSLRVGGEPVPVRIAATELVFPPGAAGLRTARLTCALVTAEPVNPVRTTVDYEIRAYADRVGWREITAVGDGVRLTSSDVLDRSPSDELRSYPEDLLSSPLDQRSASLRVAAGSGVTMGTSRLLDSGPVSAQSRGVDGFTEVFTGLVSRERLTPAIGLFAMLVATVLGALHAFAPGHGKTIMAAYLVGQRGSLRDAVVVGLSVTATHTLGVVVLGLVLSIAGLASPERVYPWLGLASGLLLVGIGVTLLRRTRRHTVLPSSVSVPSQAATATTPAYALAAATEAIPLVLRHADQHHEHRQDRGHDGHGHDGHGHDAGTLTPHSHGLFTHTHAVPQRGSGLRDLLAVGFAGGMVPSPSALVVLLGGVALGRAWLGLGLVVMYGVGMAAALALTGLLLVRVRDRAYELLWRTSSSRGVPLANWLTRVLPAATAIIVVVVGALLTLRAIIQL
jgi:nickel/cobalt exporter